MPTRPTSNHSRTDLGQAYQQFMASFDQQDAAGIAALYTEEGQLLPAYSAAIAGRAAIQAFWQGCIDMGICALHRQPAEVDQLNETVNEIGAYTLYGRAGKLLDVGKYVLIWKWAQDRWQIYRDIWTSNLPPT
jgi:ketosteroid isomerase-like protein